MTDNFLQILQDNTTLKQLLIEPEQTQTSLMEILSPSQWSEPISSIDLLPKSKNLQNLAKLLQDNATLKPLLIEPKQTHETITKVQNHQDKDFAPFH